MQISSPALKITFRKARDTLAGYVEFFNYFCSVFCDMLFGNIARDIEMNYSAASFVFLWVAPNTDFEHSKVAITV